MRKCISQLLSFSSTRTTALLLRYLFRDWFADTFRVRPPTCDFAIIAITSGDTPWDALEKMHERQNSGTLTLKKYTRPLVSQFENIKDELNKLEPLR